MKKRDEPALKIGVIGNADKGKSFILSKISKIDFPSGTSISTEGLSIKYPEIREYVNRKIALLVSAGLETPVLKETKEIIIKTKEDNKVNESNENNEVNESNENNEVDESNKNNEEKNICETKENNETKEINEANENNEKKRNK